MKISLFELKALALSGGICFGGAVSVSANTITSSDGNVVVDVVVASGNLTYSVAYSGATIIESSPLGITTGGVNLGSGVTITGYSSYSTNITFTSRQGVHATATEQLNGQQISVNNAGTGITYLLDVGVATNGVAFRYEFSDGVVRAITAESSGFIIPSGNAVYYQTNTSVYEGEYTVTDITNIASGTPMGPPVTIQLDGTNEFLALTESALGAFGSPFLTKTSDSTGRQLQVTYPVNQDGTAGSTLTATVTNTPWNVIMIGSNLDMIVNNDLVEALALAPDTNLFPGGIASWAVSGLSVWDWLNPFPGGITYTNAMTNSYWASQLGWPYNTIDSGWSSWNNSNPWPLMSEVTSYSHARGVKVIVWKTASEMTNASVRATFYKDLTNNGVDGIKIDFWDYDSISAAARERVQLRETILQEAVEYHLAVTFHGTPKPTGWFRTYPNLLQNEGVYGMEHYPGQYLTSFPPFGRILAGPADFTPLALQGSYASGKTAAFEIASVIAMPGPIITIAERSDYVAGSVFAPLIETIPSMWDQTVALSQSVLWQTTALARRKGQDWYLAVMNAGSARNWNIPLTFLSPGITYQADLIQDTSTNIQISNLTSTNVLAVSAAAAGGYVARFYQMPTNGTYALFVKSSGLALDASGGATGDNTPLIQYGYSGSSNMRWTLTALGSGLYNLIGVNSGRAATVSGAATTNNAPIVLYDYSGGSNQVFTITPNGGGYYSLIFANSGRAMTIYANSTAQGAAVIQYYYNAGTNAQWKFLSP